MGGRILTVCLLVYVNRFIIQKTEIKLSLIVKNHLLQMDFKIWPSLKITGFLC